jgi:hypothetical protein
MVEGILLSCFIYILELKKLKYFILSYKTRSLTWSSELELCQRSAKCHPDKGIVTQKYTARVALLIRSIN